ncbi:MAG TPA: lysophospholipid acyltransferase family protein [Bacteroidales bacterium]|nr:1-acylglycerol-3-phosphate O-acyltransferase [Bacteroidales bacterium]HNR41946.1 lysophospholipid acyltransferase family protein [Bacteroidales bacterium]
MDTLKSVFLWIAAVTLIVLTLPLISLIWFLVLPFDRNRKVMHGLMICLSLILVYLIPAWRIDIKGREKAGRRQTCVIISNHQSILDIIFINCLRLRFKWVSKIENMKVPVIGWYLRMADYITVDRGNKESKEEMLEECLVTLRRGISIMMFPEGTRSVDSEIGFFKRGAFQLAINGGFPILPVVIDGTGGILPKHGLIFSTGHRVKIRVFDPVMPESFGTTDPDVLSLKFHNFMADALKELRSGKP